MTHDEANSALLSLMRADVGDDGPATCDKTVWSAHLELGMETSPQEAFRSMREVLGADCVRGRWIL